MNNNKSDWKRDCGKRQDRKAKSEARKNRKIRREEKWTAS